MDIETEIQSNKDKIELVEQQICDVESKIVKIENKIKKKRKIRPESEEAAEVITTRIKELRDKESLLWNKESQLRNKESQLRNKESQDKELLLLKNRSVQDNRSHDFGKCV